MAKRKTTERATAELVTSELAAASLATTNLITDLQTLIDSAQQRLATTANQELTLLYWRVGQRIHTEVLGADRAGYGRRIVATLSPQLAAAYGRGFEKSNLHRMLKFAAIFPDEEVVVSLSQHLGWSHFIAILPVTEPLARQFYAEMCRIERWSVRTLRKKIGGMLFERTAISKKPDQLIAQELDALYTDDLPEQTLGSRPRLTTAAARRLNHLEYSSITRGSPVRSIW